jgi:hypothetical protein
MNNEAAQREVAEPRKGVMAGGWFGMASSGRDAADVATLEAELAPLREENARLRGEFSQPRSVHGVAEQLSALSGQHPIDELDHVATQALAMRDGLADVCKELGQTTMTLQTRLHGLQAELPAVHSADACPTTRSSADLLVPVPGSAPPESPEVGAIRPRAPGRQPGVSDAVGLRARPPRRRARFAGGLLVVVAGVCAALALLAHFDTISSLRGDSHTARAAEKATERSGTVAGHRSRAKAAPSASPRELTAPAHGTQQATAAAATHRVRRNGSTAHHRRDSAAAGATPLPEGAGPERGHATPAHQVPTIQPPDVAPPDSSAPAGIAGASVTPPQGSEPPPVSPDWTPPQPSGPRHVRQQPGGMPPGQRHRSGAATPSTPDRSREQRPRSPRLKPPAASSPETEPPGA